ncbi:MAG: hypothetical protein IKN64_12490 [Desulfovibrio sp.]|nr:hypothetical protein [Desulfovibrio sp.]
MPHNMPPALPGAFLFVDARFQHAFKVDDCGITVNGGLGTYLIFSNRSCIR